MLSKPLIFSEVDYLFTCLNYSYFGICELSVFFALIFEAVGFWLSSRSSPYYGKSHSLPVIRIAKFLQVCNLSFYLPRGIFVMKKCFLFCSSKLTSIFFTDFVFWFIVRKVFLLKNKISPSILMASFLYVNYWCSWNSSQSIIGSNVDPVLVFPESHPSSQDHLFNNPFLPSSFEIAPL